MPKAKLIQQFRANFSLSGPVELRNLEFINLVEMPMIQTKPTKVMVRVTHTNLERATERSKRAGTRIDTLKQRANKGSMADARKRLSQGFNSSPHLRPEPSASASRALSQLRSFRNLFDTILQVLEYARLENESSYFIATFPYNHGSDFQLQIQSATGVFKKILDRTVVPTEPSFISALALMKNSPIPVCGFKNKKDPFSFLTIGTLAFFNISLPGELSAVLGCFQPTETGEISKETLAALASQARLAELAASTMSSSQESIRDRELLVYQARSEQIREEMTQIQQFYRQFSEAVTQCFWVLDTSLRRVLLVSDNFERVWGSTRSCLTDGTTGFAETVIAEDRDKVLSQFHLNFGSDLDLEFRVVDAAGELRWIWLRSFNSAIEAKGSLNRNRLLASDQRIIFIADDITEKKNAEELLRNREAELATRAKMVAVGELASGVAHEINNPLTVIVGRASELSRLAERGELTSPALLEAVGSIRATSQRISKIVASLKSLARQEPHTKIQRIPIARVFSELKDLCTERFRNADVGLEIPNFPGKLSIEMDPTLISQMLLNLLNNALDAVENSTNKWVRVDYTEDDSCIYLYVTDSGPGIPIKIRSRIFDPFFTTKGPARGTGLGLALAANIAAHHQGSLRYDHLHSHTRFVVQLPKKQ